MAASSRSLHTSKVAPMADAAEVLGDAWVFVASWVSLPQPVRASAQPTTSAGGTLIMGFRLDD
jgi:hypothetical protein